jgi:hypothetical protein
MKRVLICAVSLLIAWNAASQKHPGPPEIVKGANENCIFKKKYSLEERFRMLKVEEDDTVKLVSFLYKRRDYPVSRDGVIANRLIETKVLSKAETNTLTNILYNNFIIKSSGISLMDQCFYPRNAIIVLSREGRVKHYILICFHCSNYETYMEKVDLGDDCNQKMAMIRGFFVSKGIYFGTDMNIDSYPGEKFTDDVQVPPGN